VICHQFGSGAITCKLKTFEVERKDIDNMMKEVKGNQKFILDLRGNGGGLVAIEEYLTGFFFDHDVKIGTTITRDKPKDRFGKTNKDRGLFTGDMVVLVDSDSASAAEIFARVMQIEKRAKIIGDVSSGKVQTSNFIPMANERGTGDMYTYSVFAMNITVSDVVMSDGNHLEKVGVVPDVIALPTPGALRDGLDPVLSFAAGQIGAPLSLEEASKLHFILKKPEKKLEKANDDSTKDQ
jgi:carboxyl-terminal processing protease